MKKKNMGLSWILVAVSAMMLLLFSAFPALASEETLPDAGAVEGASEEKVIVAEETVETDLPSGLAAENGSDVQQDVPAEDTPEVADGSADLKEESEPSREETAPLSEAEEAGEETADPATEEEKTVETNEEVTETGEEEDPEVKLGEQAKKTGWDSIKVKGKTIWLYRDQSGKAVTGQKKIDGYWYYFDLTTGERKTGFLYIPSQKKTVYYDELGRMQYGQRKIGGYWYKFKQGSGAMETGFVTIPSQNKTVYYNEQGRMQYGQKKIGGCWYNFKYGTGAMQTGFVQIPSQNKTVYYNDLGQMQYGQKKIGGYWYNFKYGTGAMQTGFVTIPSQNKTVYYDEQGRMVYGTQVIGGVTYNFHRSTGALIMETVSSGSGLSEHNWQVLINVIGAVESGGQVYGNRDYAAYAGAYANSSAEHTCTLGWAQYYGYEAEKLISRIYQADPAGFKKIDSKGEIQKMLGKDWVKLKWNPTASQKQTLIKLITTNAGKKQQDLLFREQCQEMVDDCIETYTSDQKAIIMYCEIRHQGGLGSVWRIFNRCRDGAKSKYGDVRKGDFSVDNIVRALDKDREDGFNNQVGDYTSRHHLCAEFTEKYAIG